nr:MAG TPA: hypothetical protein [Caudoviricetes sp.]
MQKRQMKIYELTPTNNQASFYGKARVVIDDEGTETLISYDTPIIERTADGKLNRLWFGDWTATTGRHIKSFCGLNKKQFMEL